MKTILAGFLLVLVFVFAWLYFREQKRNNITNTQREAERLEYIFRIDSLKTVAENIQPQIDTVWRVITRVEVRHDTVVAELKLMPPGETLAFLDSLTPGPPASALLENEQHAILPMERVRDCAIKIAERNVFEEVGLLKDSIIDLQTSQNKALSGALKESEGLVSLLDEDLAMARKAIRRAQKNCTLTTLGAILAVVVLIAAK